MECTISSSCIKKRRFLDNGGSTENWCCWVVVGLGDDTPLRRCGWMQRTEKRLVEESGGEQGIHMDYYSSQSGYYYTH
jgi:hypothetical protein